MQRDQRRLAGGGVLSCRLAHRAGVGREVEQVVSKLEGQADGRAELGQPFAVVGGGPGGDGARLAGEADERAGLHGLQHDDAGFVGAVARGVEVEHLASRHAAGAGRARQRQHQRYPAFRGQGRRLVGKDVEGYFDNRVADALRKYLGGKAALVAKPLAEMMPEYRDSRIGPYLALVSASAALPGDPKAALGFYDFARLAAPGTNVEEAALRRSLAIAAGSGMVEAGLGYANRYARRFLHSPYASQFADLFVMLAVDNYGEVADADIEGILASMDNDRKRETYLRIARKAAIVGKSELARMASARAEEIPLAPGLKSIGEVDLYSGLANLASPEVGRIVNDLVGISDEKLSQRDQALRAAAKFVGDEVLRKPDPNSLAQVDAATTPGEGPATADSQTAHDGQSKVDEKSVAQAEDANAGIDEFVSKGRSKLAQIDSLLQEGK